jgi:hypothetical protein
MNFSLKPEFAFQTFYISFIHVFYDNCLHFTNAQFFAGSPAFFSVQNPETSAHEPNLDRLDLTILPDAPNHCVNAVNIINTAAIGLYLRNFNTPDPVWHGSLSPFNRRVLKDTLYIISIALFRNKTCGIFFQCFLFIRTIIERTALHFNKFNRKTR